MKPKKPHTATTAKVNFALFTIIFLILTIIIQL
jgi:hypothetical protein